jgi:excisionase family DNA binding protein
MPVIETVSTEEAGAALGVVSATIRERIKNGSLSAVKVGRGWRIHLTSLNVLLTGSGRPSAPPASRPAVATEHKQAPASPVQNDGPRLTSSALLVAADRSSTVQNDPAAQPPPVVSDQPSLSLPPPTPPPQPRSEPLFDADDMVWINRYRRDLNDPHPQVRADAKWHLEHFAARAERDPTRRVAARMTEEEAKATAAALVAGLSRGDRTWW